MEPSGEIDCASGKKRNRPNAEICRNFDVALDAGASLAVAGPKPDVFQLHVTATLVIAIGMILLRGGRRPENGTVWLAALSAVAFVGLDVAYARWLPATYWLDAAVEALFVVLITIAVRQRHIS